MPGVGALPSPAEALPGRPQRLQVTGTSAGMGLGVAGAPWGQGGGWHPVKPPSLWMFFGGGCSRGVSAGGWQWPSPQRKVRGRVLAWPHYWGVFIPVPPRLYHMGVLGEGGAPLSPPGTL